MLLLRWILQIAHLTYAIDPIVHILFGISGQIVCATWRFHSKHMLKFLFTLLQSQSRVDLFALIQIDDTFQFATMMIGVVFQTKLFRYFTLFQCEPSPSPALKLIEICVKLIRYLEHWSESHRLISNCKHRELKSKTNPWLDHRKIIHERMHSGRFEYYEVATP